MLRPARKPLPTLCPSWWFPVPGLSARPVANAQCQMSARTFALHAVPVPVPLPLPTLTDDVVPRPGHQLLVRVDPVQLRNLQAPRGAE